MATALAMLAISETLSVAFIADLEGRTQTPAIRHVTSRMLADEREHGSLGWRYVEDALARFPAATKKDWAHLARATLAPHRENVQRQLAEVPADRLRLDAFAEPELVALGLTSPQRQALVTRRTLAEFIEPQLARLGLT